MNNILPATALASRRELHKSYKQNAHYLLRSKYGMQNEHSFELLTTPEYEGLNWVNVVVLTLFHVGAVAALFMFSWKSLAVAILLYWVGIGFGISMGYHRLHTHRSYKVAHAARVFLRCLRNHYSRRRPDLLGGHASHSSPEIGSGRAIRTRRAMVPGGRIWVGWSLVSRNTTTPV